MSSAGSGIYLAVDTATEACSAALWNRGEVCERYEVVERSHTQKVLPMIEAVMAEAGVRMAQLDGLVCGIGPGSFSGVRIGVGIVKGLALALDRPVTGVSSLAMLAQGAIRQGAASVVAAIDARMQEVYVGAYRRSAHGTAVAELADRVCAADRAPRLPVGEWRGVGTGWSVAGDALRAALGATVTRVDEAALPHAEDALWLGVPELAAGRGVSGDELVPAYLRDQVALTLRQQAAARQHPT